MVFRCQLCGECCSMMGEIISIREETRPLHFRIGYTTTGEEREVTVDRDKADLFHAVTAAGSSPACPFLRRRGAREFICSVHESRPDLCRQYSCFRILVLDSSGKKAGRVMDASRYLVTEDPVLRTIWQENIQGVDIPDETAWEAYVEEILTRRGFHVVR
jgi:Fe-S-cluster containining protein